MFKLAPKTEPFTWPVVIPEVNDSGTVVKHRVNFQFKRLSRTAFDKVVAIERTRLRQRDPDAELSADEALDINVEQALEYVAGWQDVKGPDGNPYEFTQEHLRELFDAYPGAFNAVQTAFLTAWNGGEAVRKNS